MSQTGVQSASIVPDDAPSHLPFELSFQINRPRQVTINLCDSEGNVKLMKDLKREIAEAVRKLCGSYVKAALALKYGRSSIYRNKRKAK